MRFQFLKNVRLQANLAGYEFVMFFELLDFDEKSMQLYCRVLFAHSHAQKTL